ncbi:aldolase [Achromobacter sp. DMS1]|uniref:HpcH/HpaI aldolase family protein n=1 Tax=Achromobacter sp. DMS1 TaxID=1688405 RepID=UPI00069F859C|nr:aldolase/citrate lyase family protein [Achromobacter sp. DMS1]KOF54604.1 aldolase [Achromobacter sp. DMS1]
MNTPASLPNPLMDRLRAGGLGLSMIVKQCRSVDVVSAALGCGYDALMIDLEHACIGEEAAAQICVAALLGGLTPLVRIPCHDSHYAARILDAGAAGIVAPHVTCAEQARCIVAACRFPPRGQRSVAAQWPQLSYRSVPAAEARLLIESQTVVIAMLESPEAIDNAEEIAAVEGVDILHIGSNDLCDTYGIPGRFSDPRILDAYRRVAAACGRHGKYLGAGGLGSAPEVLEQVVGLGARYVTAGNDWAFFVQAARQKAAAVRALHPG